MWQKVKNLYHLIVSFIAALIYGFPSKRLTVIGVTGTDGKTTTVNMLYQILKEAGKKVSMISSVNALIGKKVYDTGFHVTTPSPWKIQRYLKRALDAKIQYFVMETTSHGLDQNRVANVYFTIAVITNITHEHLDYHQNWQNYAKAKAKLLKNASIAILNADDQSYNFLKKRASGQIITYGTRLRADYNPKNFPIKLKIIGDYNLSNALASAATATSLGIAKQEIIKTLNNFRGVVGRMENVDLGQHFEVVVDFAHTPNALEQALKTLRLTESDKRSVKLIAVFGSAGERDRSKRPLMGHVAAKYTDISVLTAEDPRNEKVEDICAQIAEGFTKKGKKEGHDFYQVYDRKKAIEFAISLAQRGDIVATFGKSHERSMCWGKREYPWDEFAVVEGAIKKRLNAKQR